MNPLVYVCTGSCHGVATEEEHRQGATHCGAKMCEKHGDPLEPRLQCEGCAHAGPKHACAKCIISA